MLLNSIYESIEADLISVEEDLRSILKVDFPWLSEMLGYSLSGGGKRIRPALTLLCGKFYDYNLERLQPMGVAIELMHTATLVHDDAIDKSMVRRGRPTINSLWDDERAVLLGDYLFARAGECATYTQDLYVVRLFTQTLAIISSGELEQIISAFNPEQAREDYLRRISGKTASLFSLATESGAILSQSPPESIRILKDYGHYLGVAFQIVDDILDYVGTEAEIGKPVGSDLTQGTLTLPAMLLMEQHPDNNPVRRLFRGEDKEQNIALAIKMVRDSEIVEECYEIAAGYCARACRDLDQLPDEAASQPLIKLADFVVKRKN